MNWKPLITIIIFLLVGKAAFAQERPVINYTPDSEILALPSAMVTHVYQDRQGFIWFAVYSSGLVRYDGSRMILFDQDDGLTDLGIWQIIEDSAGYLWVSSHEGLVVSELPLEAYEGGKQVVFTSSIKNTPLVNDVLTHHRMALDTSGKLWVGTSESGIIRYFIDAEGTLYSDTISTQMTGNSNLPVTSIHASKGGSVLVSLEGGSLYRFTENEYTLLHSPVSSGSVTEIISILEDDEGKIWVYGQNGEILLFRHGSDAPQLIHYNSSSNINGLYSPTDGTIWATSGTDGINRFEKTSGELIDTYTRVTGLLSENVFHVTEDREGNMWIAQSGGVSKLRFNYKAFENYSSRSVTGEIPVLPSARVNSVLIPETGSTPCRAWIGTEGGATCLKKDGSSVFITQTDGLIGNWVNGLAIDSSERIWIATTQGLNGIVFSEDAIVNEAYNVQLIDISGYNAWIFTIRNSPPFIAAESLNFNRTDDNQSLKSVWFPGLRSLYGVVDGKIYHFDASFGLPATLHKSVAFDENGYLWIGTLDRGIYKSNMPVDEELIHRLELTGPDSLMFNMFWARENGAPTNHIEKLLWHNDKMWVGTQEGLYALHPETGENLNHITRENGLPADNTVSFDLSPATGNFWVGTNRGLAEVNPDDGSVLKTVTRQNGLIDNEVWLYGSVKVDGAGSVYYGTANGLSVYHPDLDRPNTIPPLIHLISFDLSYQAEGRNEVAFEYAATSFSNTSQVRYKTRLMGYNENWSPETDEVRLRYTNLPAVFMPKKYTFEVTAINENGIPAENPLGFSFTVNPVWWLQWWMFFIYVIFFGTIVYIADRTQRSRLIKKERDAARLREAELEAETANARSKAAEAQAKALQSENERKALELEKARELEIAYHELKATQNQLIQAEKMASLGRLSTGIAHEIKNPLNFINNFAEVSNEMVDELFNAIKENDKEEIHFILNNLKHNTQKIEEHGKRADSIVRSMMQHARGGKASFELMDLNDMIQKYVDLAYNGKRAKIPGFHTKLEIDLQPEVDQIKVMPQEIGQVFLNIIGNSLDAVWDEAIKNIGEYEPTVRIKTSRLENKFEIRISDNGPGVPEHLKEKIFEPFFTTKPTGEGTGLGLSLSYDIITQGHNGSLVLENTEGGGAVFIITLPVS